MRTVLKGFGGRYVYSDSAAKFSVLIDDVLVHTSAVIAEIFLDEIDIIIGQPVLYKDGISLVVKDGVARIVEDLCDFLKRITIGGSEERPTVILDEDVVLTPGCAKAVGVICGVPSGKNVFQEAQCYPLGQSIIRSPAGVHSSSESQMFISNIGGQNVSFRKGQLLARGEECSEREAEVGKMSFAMRASSVVILVTVWLNVNLAASRRLTTRSILDNEIDIDAKLAARTNQKKFVNIKATQADFKVTAGDTIELECEASGSPAPTVQFYLGTSDLEKNEVFSNEISDYQNTGLAIAKARVRYTAKKNEVIFCKATSGSKTAHAAIKVTVSGSKLSLLAGDIWRLKNKEETRHRAPRITFFDTIFLNDIGSTATLPCTARGPGQIETVWLNSSEEVIDEDFDGRFSITPFGDLKIRNIHWGDMGPYTCVARNKHGQDSITTFLYPMLADK